MKNITHLTPLEREKFGPVEVDSVFKVLDITFLLFLSKKLAIGICIGIYLGSFSLPCVD